MGLGAAGVVGEDVGAAALAHFLRCCESSRRARMARAMSAGSWGRQAIPAVACSRTRWASPATLSTMGRSAAHNFNILEGSAPRKRGSSRRGTMVQSAADK